MRQYRKALNRYAVCFGRFKHLTQLLFTKKRFDMTDNRESPIEITTDDFKIIGYQLVDTIANFLDTINDKPVTTGETPKQIQAVLGNASLPENGTSVSELFAKASDLLLNHSLLNGHPKFFGYDHLRQAISD